MWKDIQDKLSTCDTCQRTNVKNMPAPLEKEPTQPMESWSLDHIILSGDEIILVIVDDYTQWTAAKSFKSNAISHVK